MRKPTETMYYMGHVSSVMPEVDVVEYCWNESEERFGTIELKSNGCVVVNMFYDEIEKVMTCDIMTIPQEFKDFVNNKLKLGK